MIQSPGTHVPPDEGPIERLERLGADALSTEELLALVLARRLRRRSPTQVARTLLRSCGSLRTLRQATSRQIEMLCGLGRPTAATLVATLALASRLGEERLHRGRSLASSRDIFEAFHVRLRDQRKERFVAVHLDGKNRIIGENLVSEGILTASLVHPREVYQPAICASAAALVLVHNHPSGDPEPSCEDLDVTRRLCAVGELVGIRVLDHVVIGDGRYVSFLERGLLDACEGGSK